MKHKVKVIKHGDRKEPQHDRQQLLGPHPTREITTTIKLWVSEFKERRRTDEQNTRNTNKLIFRIASQT